MALGMLQPLNASSSDRFGGYIQFYGNNYVTSTLRGGVELIFDTRNSGIGGFTIFSYDGSTFASKVKVLSASISMDAPISWPISVDRVAVRDGSGFGIVLTSNRGLGFTTAGAVSGAIEFSMYRDNNARTLCLSSDSNPAIFRVYRTTNGGPNGAPTNYERLALQTGSNYVELAAESGGTGAANLDVRISPIGTGLLRYGNAITGTGTITEYIDIKDSGGTTRHIAVITTV